MSSTPNQSQQKFWDQLLGQELNQALEKDQASYLLPSGLDNRSEYDSFKTFFENCAPSDIQMIGRFLEQEIFGGIYSYIISAFLQWKKIDWNRFSILERPMDVLIRIFYERIKEIPVRVCVFEMQAAKQQGKLQGEDERAEYDWFCNRCLGDFRYIKELCGKYPEMLRLFFVRLDFTYRYLLSFFRHLENDRKVLEQRMHGGKPIYQIKKMVMGGSDSHNSGKAVIRLELDGGQEIIYKPHNLRKESIYQDLYGEVCKKMGLAPFQYWICDRGDYGWEEYLKDQECEDLEQVKRCYRRMGIHLFLCMLLNGTDMHQENILVVGEHPVILDMETIPGIKMKRMPGNAEEQIDEILRESAMKTGILPVPAWKTENNAVILSALYQDEEMYTSVKVPVFVNPKTSGMHIEYRHIKMKRGKSIPVLRGEKMYPVPYTEELCEGFSQAYRLWLEERNFFEKIIGQFWDYGVRFLVRHTQQYSMYLFTSLHPMFLSDTDARIKMLQVLQKGDTERKYVQKEVESLFQLDIPMFECSGRETISRFQSSAYECFQKRAKRCGEEDLKRQLSHIRLAMEMADPENRYNHYFSKPGSGASDSSRGEKKAAKESSAEILKKAIAYVTDSIKEMSVSKNGDMGWLNLHCEGNNFWQLIPADPFLYDGIGGIAVFLCYMKKLGLLEETDLYEQTIQKLIRDTEKQDSEETRTGLLVGAGSVAYAWLLMYQISGEERFAGYARKQAGKIERLYQADSHYDLLSGNAGAIVLLTRLYECFGEERWLELAVQIGDWLWNRAEKQSAGYGWRTKDTDVPLAGMAHGNSGFLLAYAGLLEHTGRERYGKIIAELLAYENSLYSEEKGNWRDLRYPQTEAYSNAWCHGAAGILLARLKLSSLSLSENGKCAELDADIQHAAAILFTQSERGGYCICHGMAGNYWIMTEYAKAVPSIKMEYQSAMSYIEEKLMGIGRGEVRLLPQDRYKPGLMTGMAGIGCILGMLYEKCHFTQDLGQDIIKHSQASKPWN